jgi:RNA polymerase sigma-70 factor (ECF subfamily)
VIALPACAPPLGLRLRRRRAPRAIVLRAAARERAGPLAPAARGPLAGTPGGALEAARRGDEDALEIVATQVLRMALRTAGAVLRGREEAGDVAQEVAVEVLRDLRQLRDLERFDAWVHRITVRRTLRALRRGRTRREAEVPLSALGDVDLPREAGDPLDALAAGEAVRAALTELPARQRLAVVLRYGHDLTEREVADALGCRPGSAAAMLSRARSALRESPELAAFAPGGPEVAG